MIGTDMMSPDLYLIHTESDRRVRINLSKLPNWPGDCLYTPPSCRMGARPI